MVLALICVGLLLFFIHHISQAISVNHIVDRIAEETEAMIDEMMPWPHLLDRLKDAEPLRPNPSEVAVLSDDSGYIRFIDTQRLVAIAKHYHVKHPRSAAGRPLRSGGNPPADGLQGRTDYPPKEEPNCWPRSTSAQLEPCSRTLSLASCRLSILR